jgi:hypothetical protein
MKTALMLLVIVSLLSGGAAWAGQGDQGEDNQGDRGERHGGSFGAPEPVTVVGVALGAGVAGLAAWRARRKRS